MLESFLTDEFKYEKLTEEDQQKRGILGRLVGVIADSANPTRNGRKYGKELWEKLFDNPIMKERINNRCCFGELGHPADREETDIEKIAICLAEVPKFNKKGQLCGVFDILNTPNGRILKSLCDYGCNIGVSSRGSGDIITDFDGQESVDPNTYTCEGWDAVLIPAVSAARPKYVTEALDKKRYNKSLRQKLQESINSASPDNKKVIEESLETLGINLNEDIFEDEPIDIETNDDVTSTEYVPNYWKLVSYSSTGEDGEETANIWKVVQADSLEDAESVLSADMENFGGDIEEATEEEYNIYTDNNGAFSDNVSEENDEVADDTITMDSFDFEDVPIEDDGVVEESYKTKKKVNKVNKAQNMAVADNKAIIEELQNTLKHSQDLEKQIMSLQEKLSVSNAEVKEKEDYKQRYYGVVSELSKSNQKVKALETKNNKLSEKLDKYKESLESYKEAYGQQKDKISKLKTTLTESLNKKGDAESLRESYEKQIGDLQKSSDIKAKEYDKQIAQSKKIIESLKKKVNLTVNKYVGMKAQQAGCSINEVLAKLPENYTLDDVDSICEELENYNLSLSGLPFSPLNENYTFKAKPPQREPILNITKNPDDEIDDQLKYLMRDLI